MAGVFYADGTWTTENPKLTGPMDHAFWMSSVAFDGARSFGGLAPDLDRHCARLVRSAEAMGPKPTLDATRITEFCLEAIRRFPREAELYIRPMFYGTDGFVAVDPDSTRFVLAVYDSPMPGFKGISVGLSPLRRPAPDMAPTDAKASCLYPNSQRALRDAAKRGFDNAVLRDPIGNVAELATANIWIVRDGVAQTPVDNGTFLAGITRNRVRDLLRDAGTPVVERTLTWPDVYAADEAFSTGNYGKVVPIIRIEDRALQPGPVTRRARDLYFTYAETCRVA